MNTSHSFRYSLSLLCVAATTLGTSPSGAQQTAPDQALNQYQPPEAGDDFMAVPGSTVDGHLQARGQLIFDYARNPLQLEDENGDTVATPVSDQGFLHFGASLALWDRLLVGLSFPLAVFQSGEEANVGTASFPSADGVAAGDIRLGLRGHIVSVADGAFSLGAGGFVFFPSGSDEYAGDGSVYGEPHLLVGGKIGIFRYDANLGSV
ncbi:MAG: hypothetical protein AAGA56_22585, partial [Myxococcota bacterium]